MAGTAGTNSVLAGTNSVLAFASDPDSLLSALGMATYQRFNESVSVE